MTSPQRTSGEFEHIPVIDVGPLLGEVPDRVTAMALRNASQDPGFIYIRDHGIPTAVIDNARSAAHEFFALDHGRKADYTVSKHHRGWLDSGGARMGDDAPADLKESFIWSDEATSSLTDHSLRGPNQWPDQDVAMLRPSALAWYEHAHQLSVLLMRGIAVSLDLDPQHFLITSDRPLSRASFVFYPPQPASASAYGVGPHTDFGTITVLAQDNVGGLEIKTSEGSWVPAPPIADTLIVNVGDLLERWSNGAFRSATHRVNNRGSRQRLSLVFAFDPNPETVVDGRSVDPSLGTNAQKYADPITCGDYLDWRFGRAFSYRT